MKYLRGSDMILEKIGTTFSFLVKQGRCCYISTVPPFVPNPRFVPHLWVFHYGRVYLAKTSEVSEAPSAGETSEA
jgi:hypothetical protein